MPTVLLAHVAATAAYAGFQVLVQVLVYRSFPLVPAAAFPAYVHHHQQRVTRVVGPLFAALTMTTAGVAAQPAAPAWGRAGAVALLAAVLGLTALGAVPQHRVLARGFDTRAHRALLRVDLARTAAALGNAATAVLLAGGGAAA